MQSSLGTYYQYTNYQGIVAVTGNNIGLFFLRIYQMSRWLKMCTLRVKDEFALVLGLWVGLTHCIHSWYGMVRRYHRGDNQCSTWHKADNLTPTSPAIVMDSFAEKLHGSLVPIFKDLVDMWGTMFVSSYHVQIINRNTHTSTTGEKIFPFLRFSLNGEIFLTELLKISMLHITPQIQI